MGFSPSRGNQAIGQLTSHNMVESLFLYILSLSETLYTYHHSTKSEAWTHQNPQLMFLIMFLSSKLRSIFCSAVLTARNPESGLGALSVGCMSGARRPGNFLPDGDRHTLRCTTPVIKIALRIVRIFLFLDLSSIWNTEVVVQ